MYYEKADEQGSKKCIAFVERENEEEEKEEKEGGTSVGV